MYFINKDGRKLPRLYTITRTENKNFLTK